jgi:hypothetical protein
MAKCEKQVFNIQEAVKLSQSQASQLVTSMQKIICQKKGH